MSDSEHGEKGSQSENQEPEHPANTDETQGEPLRPEGNAAAQNGGGGEGGASQPPPKRFWRDYEPIEKFTLFLTLFTGLLVVIGGLQVFFFARSERGELNVIDVRFKSVEPNTSASGLDLIFVYSNTGKHAVHITEMCITPGVFTKRKDLPADPKCISKFEGRTPPPILPNTTLTIAANNRDWNFLLPPEKLVAGILNGSVPVRVWGRIEYDTGYNWFGKGITGFCFEYVPGARRAQGETFMVCDAPQYIYND